MQLHMSSSCAVAVAGGLVALAVQFSLAFFSFCIQKSYPQA